MSIQKLRAQRAPVTVLANAGFHPEVQKAVDAWAKTEHPGVLIGGVAMSFYAKPRYTQDVDVLYLTNADVPKEVSGFKHNRPGAFEHRTTGVEIEVTTSTSFSDLPLDLARKVIAEAVEVSPTFRVASREGLIAMKLFSSNVEKRTYKDLADVVALLDGHTHLNMAAWPLHFSEKAKLEQCRKLAAT